jgi:DNA polymerase I
VQAAASVEEARARCDALAPPPPGVAGPSATRRQWNWNSAQQVGEALELLGASLPTTERGNAKTDAAALQAVTEPAAAAELAATLLRYREAKKDASTWGLGWFDPPQRKGNRFDKPHQFVVGDRVFTSFRQVVRTGRMSSESPNLQNLPPRLRRFFVAPPGRKLVVADYKNIELVLAGVIAGEPRLLDAFRRGEDVHSNTARGMLLSDPKRGDAPVTDEEIKAFRPVAKLVAFSLLYGSGPKGLAEGLTNKVGVSTSIEEAKGLLVSFFGAYPKLKRWYELERVRAANCDDRCRTLTGRLRLLDLQYRYGKWRANPQMRLNSPVQGSAGDGIKCAVALLWERRHDCPGAPVVVNLVHDEIVVEVDAEHAETCKGWLARCMEDGMAEVAGPGVPARAEIVVADTWGVE